MHHLEQQIRERAYHLWIADGRRDGDPDFYWLKAQQEIIAQNARPMGAAKRARPARAKKARAA